MMDERMDLSALEPDDRQRERLVGSIMKRAAVELARRASLNVSPIAILSDWLRPALAAAAVLAVVCTSVLMQRELSHTQATQGYTDALDVPSPVNEWLASGRSPTAADLMIAMDRE